jgi:hypothetical protein
MKLPDSRAFLVRLSEGIDPAVEPMGRIEHIESGLRARFSSVEEMWLFIGTTVAREEDTETAGRSCEPYER